MTLAALKPGDRARIISIDERGGDSVHRLCEMGLVEGQLLTVLKEAPLGDPLAIKIMNYELCLRRKEADAIQVKLED